MRLLLAPFTSDPVDLRNWEQVGRAVADGQSPYALTLAKDLVYPYPPLWSWICAAAVQLHREFFSTGNEAALRLLLKLPSILADVAMGLLIAVSNHRPRRAAALYLFNPLPIALCAVWGMFDALPTLFLLASVQLLERGRTWRSALLFGVACSFKLIYPAFLLPWFLVILIRRQGVRTAAGYFGVVVVLLAAVCAQPLIEEPRRLFDALFGFHSQRPPQVLNLWAWLRWSVSGALKPLATQAANITLPLALVTAFAVLVRREPGVSPGTLRRGLVVLVATFFVASKVVNEPYALWLTALLFGLGISGERWALRISALATFAIAVHYGLTFFAPVADLPHLPRRPLYWLLGWTGLAFWAADVWLLFQVLTHGTDWDETIDASGGRTRLTR